MTAKTDLAPRVSRLEAEVEAIRGEMRSGFDGLRAGNDSVIAAIGDLKMERQRDLQNKIERAESRKPQWPQLALAGFGAAAFFALVGNGIMVAIDLRTAPINAVMAQLTASMKGDFGELGRKLGRLERDAALDRQKTAQAESKLEDLKSFQHWLIYIDRAPERAARQEAAIGHMRRDVDALMQTKRAIAP